MLADDSSIFSHILFTTCSFLSQAGGILYILYLSISNGLAVCISRALEYSRLGAEFCQTHLYNYEASRSESRPNIPQIARGEEAY